MRRFVFLSMLMIILVAVFSCVSVKKEPVEMAAAKLMPAEMINLVDSLEVFDDVTKSLWQIRTNIQKNEQQFSDRAYLIIELPDSLAGAAYVHTAADAKKYTGEILATMVAKADIDVYMAHDTRIVQKPVWMSAWVDTGEVIVNSEVNPTSFGVFKRSYKKGETVTFGSNGQSGGCLMYMILFAYPGFAGEVQRSSNNDFSAPVTWPGCLGMLEAWFSTDAAIGVADNLLLYQYNTGGWGKNLDMAVELTEAEKQSIISNKHSVNDSTIDNNGTTTQILFLAKVYTATKEERFKDAALKGINYLLKAQYPSGGWPQFYPVNKSLYYAHITFNDNAMINVLVLFESILQAAEFAFVDEETKGRIQVALDKGLEAVLKTQIILNGKKTAWCAQHYADTLLPAPARSYELESISGYESIGVIRYLMSIENPTPEIIDAVGSAVAWFDANRITGILVKEIAAPQLDGGRDLVVVEDASAPPIWARFYDLETGKPFFCGRDGVKKASLAEIEHERRMGYSYYTSAPLVLLTKEYPVWQEKYASGDNVIKDTAGQGIAASAAVWNVYDASVLPAENDPAFYESNSTGLRGESSIVRDMDISGNNLLQFISPEGPDNKLCWTMNLGMEQNATILLRARAIEGYVKAMAFDIEVRSGKYRDRLIGFENGTIKLDKAGVSAKFDGQSWNVVRIVLSGESAGGLQIDVYLNEQVDPVLSGISTTKHADNLFRFADGSGNDYAASYYDWVVWTVDGAYGPGSQLPAGLTGLEM